MADLKYYDVILKPVITEKSMNSMAEKKSALEFIKVSGISCRSISFYGCSILLCAII